MHLVLIITILILASIRHNQKYHPKGIFFLTNEQIFNTNIPSLKLIDACLLPVKIYFFKLLFRWGTTDRTVGDISTNTGPYVRRRSGVDVNESTVFSVTSCLPPPTTNVIVTSSSNIIDDSKGRTNRDEEAEAQRKHRSAQARRERRSTQSVTVEDIKSAEQQIKSRSNEMTNNKIGAPLIPSTNNEHDIETERLQKVIEDKKDKIRNETINDLPTIIANDSLNLSDPRRRTNRVSNQRKMTWNNVFIILLFFYLFLFILFFE